MLPRSQSRLARYGGLLDPQHGPDEQCRIDHEAECDRGEESDHAEVEPVDGDEPARDVYGETHRVCRRGRGAATEAQRDVEQAETRAEEEIGRRDDVQIETADAEDLGVVAE